MKSASHKRTHCTIPLLVTFIEMKSRMVVARGQEARGMGSCCVMGRELQFGKMKRDMEMDGGDFCTIMLMYLMLLNCTFRNG